MKIKTPYPLTHLPINKAMELLGVSKYKFYGLVNDRRLTIKKVGKKSFVAVSEINALFEEQPETISQ